MLRMFKNLVKPKKWIIKVKADQSSMKRCHVVTHLQLTYLHICYAKSNFHIPCIDLHRSQWTYEYVESLKSIFCTCIKN